MLYCFLNGKFGIVYGNGFLPHAVFVSIQFSVCLATISNAVIASAQYFLLYSQPSLPVASLWEPPRLLPYPYMLLDIDSSVPSYPGGIPLIFSISLRGRRLRKIQSIRDQPCVNPLHVSPLLSVWCILSPRAYCMSYLYFFAWWWCLGSRAVRLTGCAFRGGARQGGKEHYSQQTILPFGLVVVLKTRMHLDHSSRLKPMHFQLLPGCCTRKGLLTILTRFD